MKVPRNILITGASSGIGRALAVAYSEDGVVLYLGGRDQGRLEEVAAQCQALGAAASIATNDVADKKAMAAWVATADDATPLDLVIANAALTGGLRDGTHPEQLERAQRLITVNLFGILNTIHPAMDRMIERGQGQVALVGSMAGYRGLPYSPAYCASKAAIKVYGESLRTVLSRHGVKVSTICPGFVDTPLNEIIDAPKPFMMNPEKAAMRIKRGLARRRRLIALPRRLYFLTLLHAILPRSLTDFFVARVSVHIPETPLPDETDTVKGSKF